MGCLGIAEAFGQDVLDRLRRPASGEGAGHDPGHPVEVTRTPQLGQHPVDAVVLLVDVLEQQDAAARRAGRAGGQRGGKQAQRAAGGDAASRAGDHGDGPRIPDHGGLFRPHQGAQQGAERVVRRALPDGDHRPEYRRPAELDRHRLEHRRHVRVAGQHLRRHPGRQPSQSIASRVRCAPEPPRANRIPAMPGSVSADRRSPARIASSPAR